MDRRTWATVFLSVPLVIAAVVPALILSGIIHTWGSRFEAALAVAMFVVGPVMMLIGHGRDSTPLMASGATVYVATILLWSLSWGGLHLLVGGPAVTIGMLLRMRTTRQSHPGPL